MQKLKLIKYLFIRLGNHLPLGKNFTKIRPGTLGSCLTFLMNLYDAIVEADNLQVCENLMNLNITPNQNIFTLG